MKVLIFLLIPFICMGQSDTSYTIAENYKLFNIHLTRHADGREVMEKTPITDSVTITSFLTREFEKIAINHYKAASTVFFSKQVAVSIEDQNARFAAATGFDPGSVLTKIVSKSMGTSVDYDGIKWSVDGKILRSQNKQVKLRAYCLQWIRVTEPDGSEIDLFQIKPGEYRSISGKTLKVNKK